MFHGLRKSATKALADAGCSPHEIMAITGHKTLAMVREVLRSKAEQKKLAKAAILKLENARK